MAKKESGTYVEQAADRFIKGYLQPQAESFHRLQLYELLVAFGQRVQRRTRCEERDKKTSATVKRLFGFTEGTE